MSIILSILALAVPANAEQSTDRSRYPGCNTKRCERRMERKAHRKTVRRWWRTVRPVNGYLNSIAACESGGKWHISTGNGFHGGLQFTVGSWYAAGGRGMPHHASPLEQKYRAVRLARLQGWGAWPNCS